MKRGRIHSLLGLAFAVLLLCLAQADAQAEPQGGMPYGKARNEHPVASMVSHIVIIAITVGAGASVVAALFKTPFRQ